jgi:[FeFe] hydrogenase (group B1/B3)
MRLFDTEVQELKYKVLKELVRHSKNGDLGQSYYDIPRTIIPGPKATMRCCIYRERAIVQERLKLASGGNKENDNVVEVIDIACEECPATRYSVTDNCRKCIAHRCYAVCPAGAISFEKKKAKIDPEKCLECGRCIKECPYNAIAKSQPPCIRSCMAGAISLDSERKAKITNEKCIRCGACVYNCPFGAIVDKSYVLDVLKLLEESAGGSNFNVYAAVAPSIAGQFNYAKIGQVVSGIQALGFHSVVEVARGAEAVARKEAQELAAKGFLLSSCCPSFVKYVEINFPELKKHLSHQVSPMAEIAQAIKKTDKTAKVVFIGPCIAKKMEFRQAGLAGVVDSVLTFEELQALFDGMDIHIEDLPETTLSNASFYGRIFARNGGLASAVTHFLEDEGGSFAVEPEIGDGIAQCKSSLLKAAKGKLAKNFVEGMACEGGCVGGPACLSHGLRVRMAVDKFAQQGTDAAVQDAKPLMVSAK